jgi:IS605 OrfB family transposase
VQSIRTVRCRILVPPEKRALVDSLFERYSQASTEIAAWGRDHRESNAVRLQHQLYYGIRRNYGLPANLTITALRRVSAALAQAKFKGRFQFRPTFVALDARTFTLKLSQGVVSFSTHEKRVSAALLISDYEHEALWGAQIAQSAVLVKAKDGFWINIAIESGVPEVPQGGTLGVDLGIRRLASTSTGRRFSGTVLREYRESRWRVRASLQSKGTKGARRALKRLSGRERRRAAWENHRISKWIVEDAAEHGCSAIALEDLRGIRDRLQVRNRHRNRMVSMWAFAQLGEFIRYKAAAKGIRVNEVDPAYTSLVCHQCHKMGMRTLDLFTCRTCGEFDADLNAAKNIAAGGARAGDIPAYGNVAQIVDFFAGESLHCSQSKAAGL